MVKAVPGRSADFGDLMDSHTWSVMEQVMSNSVTDVVVFIPSSATDLDTETNCLPALRGASGHAWHGLPGLPADLKDAITKEDQTWLRVAEAALGLAKLRKEDSGRVRGQR